MNKTHQKLRRLAASASASIVSGLTFGVNGNKILVTNSTTIKVIAKDSKGDLIKTGGDRFTVNNIPMIDYNNGTYSYIETFNNIGKITFVQNSFRNIYI